MPRKSEDSQIVDDLIAITKNFYRQNYTGFDTPINRATIIDHIGSAFKETEQATDTLRKIENLIKND